jgi:small-conductance mechanosensitive channel
MDTITAALNWNQLAPFVVEKGAELAQTSLRLVLVFVAGYVGMRLVNGALARLEERLVRAGEAGEPVPGSTRRRVHTLTSMLRSLALSLLWAVVVVMALDQLGVDITPVIAGAGIVGLAVGFGAQNLVRDVIAGFFMVLENQVRVGDVAVINGTGGLVERLTFRTIVLRDLAGVVHVFPNGTITTLSNMTLGWSGYLIDMGVAYKEDTDRVSDVMHEVAEEMRGDPEYRSDMLGPIEVFGVDDFADSAVVIKARLRTQPLQQWKVGREYRRRLKKAFDAAGIEIPFPHRSIYVGEATKPFPVQVADAAGGTAPTPGRE